MAKLYSKIFNHTHLQEINELLLKGESLRSIVDAINAKTPRRHNISISLLSNYRRDILNVSTDDLLEIKDNAAQKTIAQEREKIVSSNAYKDMLNDIVSKEIDVARKMIEMEALISSRIEHYFNVIEEGGSFKDEKLFLEFLNAQRTLMADWKKWIEGVADKTVEHNINVNIVNEQVNVLKGIVFEVLSELDPAVIPIFIDKVNARLDGFDYDGNKLKRIEVIDAE